MGKKKICFIMSTPNTARFFLQKHFEVLSREFDIYVVANLEFGEKSPYQNQYIISAYHVDIHREIDIWKDLKALFKLRNYLAQMNFDAVLSVTPKAGLIGILASRLAGIENRIHIYTGQVWHTRKGLFKRLLIVLDQFIFFNSSYALVDGQAQRQFLIGNNVITQRGSRVLGKGSISGVDLDRFKPDENVRLKWRKELGYSPENVVFMFLGRTNYDKGIIELTNASNRLIAKYPDARVIYVGFDEDGLIPTIKQIFGNSTSFHFFGPTPMPEQLLQACDVFCLPSHREGFGTSIIEASLLEKPIICSDTYGLMETIVDQQTGLRHPVGDADAIFDCMEKLMTDFALRQRLGKNGRKYVNDYFSAEMISGEWLKFFREILT